MTAKLSSFIALNAEHNSGIEDIAASTISRKKKETWKRLYAGLKRK